MENKTSQRLLVLVGLLLVTLILSGVNAYQLNTMEMPAQASASASSAATGTANAVAGSAADIIPRGVPAVYGAELGVNFDDVSANDPAGADATIRKLAAFDDGITLSGADKERYINILFKMENGISCEYCCGARAIIFETGEPACGCAHSYAMRGLTKYLLTEHGSEYTDAQILEEAGKWKTLFFPGQIQQKAAILESKGIPLNYINLASNKYRGIERGTAGGGMVGGC